jgi:hypothetical protein
MLCDGCNVNEGWEHKCHTPNQKPSTMVVRGERIYDVCECEECRKVYEFSLKLNAQRKKEDA